MNNTTTGLVYDDIYLQHDTGPHHPETEQRLTAIIKRLKTERVFDNLLHIKPVKAQRNILELGHESNYIDRLKTAVDGGFPFLDTPECPISFATFDAALYATGGALKGIDAVMEGRIKNCFCAVRPPGHHAEKAKAMGFCYFNNIAIAAKYLQKQYSIEKILILDWDVHHGNGTQHTFEEDPSVFYISFHQDPASCYPGTGWVTETGKGKGKGYTHNFPMQPGSGNRKYMDAMEKVEELMDNFKPQFVLVSAGFDAHIADPLAQIKLTVKDFEALTLKTMEIAETYAEGRIVSLLEGGYNLKALAESVAGHIRLLMEKNAKR